MKFETRTNYTGIAVRNMPTPLWNSCNMGSHSVTCHPAEVTSPPLPQPFKVEAISAVIFCGWYRDAGVDIFLLRGSEEVDNGGSDGPWIGADSVSLSPPKLVINSTTAGAEEPGDLDRDRDDDILCHTSIHSAFVKRRYMQSTGTLIKCSLSVVECLSKSLV